eukprot:jgi/Psemu1/204888/e_gw1.360.2.1
MNLSEDTQNCPICLEPIFGDPSSSTTEDATGGRCGGGGGGNCSHNTVYNVGATVPCGHLFHYDCFGSWQASKSYGAVKCPTCNVQTQNFVRLYLDVASLGGAHRDPAGGDDISLSSIDDDGIGDNSDADDDEEEEEGNEASDDDDEHDGHNDKRGAATDANEAGNDRVVDLTESPQEQQNQIYRLTRIAKKFKRQCLQKNVQYKEQYAEKRKLSDRVRCVEDELKASYAQVAQMETQRDMTALRFHESQLSLARIQRERDALESQYKTAAEEQARAEARFKACRAHYEQELENVRARSMSEVQQILEDHPKKTTNPNNNNNHSTVNIVPGQYSSLASRMMKARSTASSVQSAVVRDLLAAPPPTPQNSATKKRSSLASLGVAQNKRLKSFSASRRDAFQRKPR